jgi:hypothetical protein
MSIGDNFDPSAWHHELCHYRCAVRIRARKFLAVDGIHTGKILRIRQVDKNLRNVGHRPARCLNGALEIGQGYLRLGADLAGFD